MKTMICSQLGGACNKTFSANTFEEIAEQSKQHGLEMFEIGDKPHLEAMQQMKNLMQSPEAMQNWFENKRKEFKQLPED